MRPNVGPNCWSSRGPGVPDSSGHFHSPGDFIQSSETANFIMTAGPPLPIVCCQIHFAHAASSPWRWLVGFRESVFEIVGMFSVGDNDRHLSGEADELTDRKSTRLNSSHL